MKSEKEQQFNFTEVYTVVEFMVHISSEVINHYTLHFILFTAAFGGYGRLAQRESAAFTRQKSLVRSQHRPPIIHVRSRVEFTENVSVNSSDDNYIPDPLFR